MATQLETFKLWYAKGGNNKFSDADNDVKIQNVTTPEAEKISLIYCMPSNFSKRSTDVSTALAADIKSPDTGTGVNDVILRFTQERKQRRTIPVLPKLLKMFYLKSSDDDFHAGRFGLENTDNPELDCLPVKLAGYKLESFKQEPNQNTPTIQIWEIRLKFVGDHTKLGSRG